MRKALIGHTGFLGGNLAAQTAFSHSYNSKNISQIEGEHFDLVICGGVTATKWWANQNPAEDRTRIDSLLRHLSTVRAERFVVLSTVDVYPVLQNVTESFDCASARNHPYGSNRLYFEQAVRAIFPQVTVVRISGVVGPGLKKNVIFDLMHDNCLDAIQPGSSFQYYNAANLWQDMQRILAAEIPLVNLASEPVPTARLAARLFPHKSIGKNAAAPVHYDIRTQHTKFFSGSSYRTTEEEIVTEIGRFAHCI
ncbi:MAG TPA: NAD-dependent epimerase/dehydratase family protein [Bryobacteraceae bacterium]|nr:NAD-dependent epimerase/dehydratase family protein [Bryobacteraceae bacterium]